MSGRKCLWCILIVSLLLFISLEAAIADGDDNHGSPSGKIGGNDDDNGVKNGGKNGGKDDDDDGKKGGDDDGKKGGNNGGNNDDDDGKKGDKDDGDKGKGKDNDKNRKGDDDDDKNGKGDDDDDKNGKGNNGGKTTPSPSSPTSQPPTQTPSTPSSPVPSLPPPTPSTPSQNPPSSPVPFLPTPSQNPPSSPVPSLPTPSTPSQNPPSSPVPLPSVPTPSTSLPTPGDPADYYEVSPIERNGPQRFHCTPTSACATQTLTCPEECPTQKPKDNHMRGCFVDCSVKCETSCKRRIPQCDGFGSLCYDPRFVGGDGSMFYFHGSKGSDFAIVSDDDLHINAHFIGTRPVGRTRDFTWVQALSIMFDTHTLILAAKRVTTWGDKVEALIVKWDNEMIKIPFDGEAEWKINTGNRNVVVERTDDYNTVRATVSGLVQVDIKVTPIGDQENRVHHYQIPADDAFAHLETQFKFFKLSDSVEGVLGKTYQPGFVGTAKMGVAMPLMGGEDKYQTPSLTSPLCKLCRFQRPSIISMVTAAA